MHVVLRLKVEEKKNIQPYDPEMLKEITYSMQEAILRLKLKNPVFETLVKLKNNKVDYCQFKMSASVWRFFIAAFGSIEDVEADYEIFLI